MNKSPTKIVAIHDNLEYFPEQLEKSDPLMATLALKYGIENVILFKHSNEGLEYILKSLGQKLIVLLDKNFEDKRDINGLKVFEEIRKETSLVYVILTSVSNLSDIGEDNLIYLINHELFGFISFTSNYSKIIEVIERAVQKLDARVDSAIEEWISLHPEEDKDKPYITTRDGKMYSLRDIMKEIRLETPYGIEMQKKILMLAIDMLARGKKQIDG